MSEARGVCAVGPGVAQMVPEHPGTVGTTLPMQELL